MILEAFFFPFKKNIKKSVDLSMATRCQTVYKAAGALLCWPLPMFLATVSDNIVTSSNTAEINMSTTKIPGILVIDKPEILEKEGRARPYYRVDIKLEGIRMAKTVTIPDEHDGEAWREICKFRARTKQLQRTPSTWIRADPQAKLRSML